MLRVGRTRGRQGHDPRADPIAGAARLLLDCALALERGEQSGSGALGQLDPVGDLGHPDRAVGERGEHGERPLDRLDPFSRRLGTGYGHPVVPSATLLVCVPSYGIVPHRGTH